MEKNDLDQVATKHDLEDMAAHIISTILKGLEDYPTKQELKEEIYGVEKRLGDKIDNQSADTSDLRRRVIDIETESATRTDLNEHKRVGHPL